MKKVCFVCLGNICRSPMAEGLFRKMVEERGLEDQITVLSRATSSYETGNPPHPKTTHILNRLGISTRGMVSEKIADKDFETCDYIIGMDDENINYLKKHANGNLSKIYLLRDVYPKTAGEIVADPYYSGEYEKTYQLIQESLEHWIEKIILDIHK